MKFIESELLGAYIIQPSKLEDERGFFSRMFCKVELEKLNLDANIAQINNSFSSQKNTLRGIHLQQPPMSETKIVRCISGEVWDVIVDLRPDSKTFGKWDSAIISEHNRKMIYLPKGFGHAFLTMKDDTELVYSVSEFYSPENEIVVNWNDPLLSIDWPDKPLVISEKDSLAPFISDIKYFRGVVSI